MWPRLNQAAAELGLAFGERTHTFNSRLACEVAKWAEQQGHGWQFHLATYEAYFVQGKNIAQPLVLQDVADQAGLEGVLVPDVTRQEDYAAQVDRDWARCADRGVRAIPTIDDGTAQLVGFQPRQAQLSFLQR